MVCNIIWASRDVPGSRKVARLTCEEPKSTVVVLSSMNILSSKGEGFPLEGQKEEE